MKTSEITVEAIEALKKFESLVLSADDLEPEYKKTIEVFTQHLAISVFRNIMRVEYVDRFLNSKKITEKKFINNPKKILGLFQNQVNLDSRIT
jgi:tRNA(Ser,Leu) C12 N-acetylase TAN1